MKGSVFLKSSIYEQMVIHVTLSYNINNSHFAKYETLKFHILVFICHALENKETTAELKKNTITTVGYLISPFSTR